MSLTDKQQTKLNESQHSTTVNASTGLHLIWDLGKELKAEQAACFGPDISFSFRENETTRRLQ